MKEGNRMLYIPMFKGRRCEHLVIKDVKQCFSNKIIPLIEVLQEHYPPTEFARDPITGEFLKRESLC